MESRRIQAALLASCLISDFLVFPFLDGIGNQAGLFVGIRLVMVFLGEMFDRFVDRFRLAVGVRVGHGNFLSILQEKALGIAKGLLRSEGEPLPT